MASSSGDHSSYSTGMSAAERQRITNLLTNVLQVIDEGGRSRPNTVETSLGPSTSSSGTRRSGPNSTVETSLGPASSGTSSQATSRGPSTGAAQLSMLLSNCHSENCTRGP